EPGPTPTATHSIDSRSRRAAWSASSIRAKAGVRRPSVRAAWPAGRSPSTIATLRRAEENSIAKILINNPAVELADAHDGDPAQPDPPMTGAGREELRP